jgi:hypothetical protein
MKYKSEERRKEPSFFTQEYMKNRYVNDRVEMELKDFKAEIEKKFEGSKLRQFKFPLLKVKPATSRPNRMLKAIASSSQPRGHSAEEDPIEAILKQQPQRVTLAGKNVIFKTTASALHQSTSKPSANHKLEDFPADMIKTHDVRQQHHPLVKDTASHGLSLNDSINEMQPSIENSIVYIDKKSGHHRQQQ